MVMEFVDFENSFSEVEQFLVDTSDVRTREGAEMVKEEWIRSIITGGRSGRLYNGHRASAPGEPPANWSGELVNSIDVTKEEGAEGPEWGVGSPLDYALYLELGTFKMAPRPSLNPAYQKVEQRLISQIAKEWL